MMSSQVGLDVFVGVSKGRRIKYLEQRLALGMPSYLESSISGLSLARPHAIGVPERQLKSRA